MDNGAEINSAGHASVEYRPGGFAVAAFVGAIALFIAAIGFFLWYVPTVGLSHIHPALPYALGAVIIIVVGFVAIGGIAVASSAMRGASSQAVSPMFRGLLVKFFLPVTIMASGLFKIPKIKVEQVFIDLNNKMVRGLSQRKSGFKPEKIILLMPHCIQFDDCKIKVTRDVDNCVECGKCEIAELLTVSRKYGLKFFVLTGGTVARRKLKEFRPDAVVAVACERDLTSGVQDAYPLPVLAIVNKRPLGYCLSTGVDMTEVKNAIEALLNPESAKAA